MNKLDWLRHGFVTFANNVGRRKLVVYEIVGKEWVFNSSQRWGKTVIWTAYRGNAKKRKKIGEFKTAKEAKKYCDADLQELKNESLYKRQKQTN